MPPFAKPILIVAPSFGVPRGGVELYLERLATGLASLGVAVEVAAPDAARSVRNVEDLGHLTVRRFPTVNGTGETTPPPQMIRWVFSHARDYAVLNAHNLHTIMPLITCLAARISDVPFVLTSHWHGTGHSSVRRLMHIPYRPVAMWIARSANVVICNSDAEAAIVRKSLGSQVRIQVIPVGIDRPRAMPNQDGSFQAPDGFNGKTVLAVGRLEAYKGTDKLVRTVRLLPAEYRLVVVGTGPAAKSVANTVVAEGVSDRVLLRGRCSDAELRAWYGHAAACVSLSAQESFGIVVLEAAASGCPVVASDIPPHRELAQFAPKGVIELIPLNAPLESIAATIVRQVGKGRGSGVWASDDWRLPTWEHLVEQVLNVYAAAASSRSVG
jgi:glycosyltransferase involved in cell wall biosynthesis